MLIIADILKTTESMLVRELDIPEPLLQYDKILRQIYRDLHTIKHNELSYTLKGLPDKRAVDNFLYQHFAKNPVVNPCSSDRNSQVGVRQAFQSGSHGWLHEFSRNLRSAFRKNGR